MADQLSLPKKSKQQKTNKNRKYGRNSTYCQVYQLNDTRRKNKKRRLLTLLHTQPRNEQLVVALDKLNVSETRINQAIRGN